MYIKEECTFSMPYRIKGIYTTHSHTRTKTQVKAGRVGHRRGPHNPTKMLLAMDDSTDDNLTQRVIMQPEKKERSELGMVSLH